MDILRHPKTPPLLGIVLLYLLVVLCELHTRSNFDFSYFYVVPVAIAAFRVQPLAGVVAALAFILTDVGLTALAIARYGVERNWPELTVRGAALLAAALSLAWLRTRTRPVTKPQGIDPDTGLQDREGFLGSAASEMARSRRIHVPFALIVMEVDFVEAPGSMPDPDGRAREIRRLSVLLRTHSRSSDHVGRISQGRFGIFLPDTGRWGASRVLQKIRPLISEELARDGSRNTCRIGALSFHVPPPDIAVLLRMADAILAEAGKEGPNGFRMEDVPDPVESMLGALTPGVQARA